ncbi:CHAD domain-containing protein [Streptomyces sp. NBC_00390]
MARYLHAQAADFLRSLRLHSEGGADTQVVAGAAHALRHSSRRISGTLHTFRPLLDGAWADGLRTELGWLSATLAHEHACTSRLDRLLAALSRLSGTAPLPAARQPLPAAGGSRRGSSATAGHTAGTGGPGNADDAAKSGHVSEAGPGSADDAADPHGPGGRAGADPLAGPSSADGSTNQADPAAAGRGPAATGAALGAAASQVPAQTSAHAAGAEAGGVSGTERTGNPGEPVTRRTVPAGSVGAPRSAGSLGLDEPDAAVRPVGRPVRAAAPAPVSAAPGAGATAEARRATGTLAVGAARAGALLERQLTLARTRAHSAALQTLGSSRFHAVADAVAVLASELPLAPAAERTAAETLVPQAETAEQRLLEAVAALPLGRAAHPYNADALMNGLATAGDEQDAPWHEVRRLLRLHRYAQEVLYPGADQVLRHAGRVLDRHRDAAEAAAAAAAAARTPRIAPATAYALGVLHADQRHEVEAARFAFQQEWRHATAVSAP